jgi:hypothetical protein
VDEGLIADGLSPLTWIVCIYQGQKIIACNGEILYRVIESKTFETFVGGLSNDSGQKNSMFVIDYKNNRAFYSASRVSKLFPEMNSSYQYFEGRIK